MQSKKACFGMCGSTNQTKKVSQQVLGKIEKKEGNYIYRPGYIQEGGFKYPLACLHRGILETGGFWKC